MRSIWILLAAVLLALGLVSAIPVQEGLQLPVQSSVPQNFAQVEIASQVEPKLIGSPRSLGGAVGLEEPKELVREKRQLVYSQYYTPDDESDIVEKDDQVKV